jgi:hypothetical protein
LAFTFGLGKSPENLSRRPSDESCATSLRLKWGHLPPNEVGRIAQHIRKGEERKERKYHANFMYLSSIHAESKLFIYVKTHRDS